MFEVLGILVGTNHWGSPVFSVYKTLKQNLNSEISPSSLRFAIETAVLAFSKLGLAVKLILVAVATIVINSFVIYRYAKTLQPNQST